MFKGCNFNIKRYLPYSVLFIYDGVEVTVTMAINSLNGILKIIEDKKYELSRDYKKAILVFESLKLILSNKTPSNHSKEELNLAIDILEEILKMYTKTNEENKIIHNYALNCKLLITMNLI